MRVIDRLDPNENLFVQTVRQAVTDLQSHSPGRRQSAGFFLLKPGELEQFAERLAVEVDPDVIRLRVARILSARRRTRRATTYSG
jgi:hypothetical protein